MKNQNTQMQTIPSDSTSSLPKAEATEQGLVLSLGLLLSLSLSLPAHASPAPAASARNYSTSQRISKLNSGVPKSKQRVQKFVDQYVEKSLQTKWKKYSRVIAQAVLAEAKKHQFDPLLLLAMIQNESSFNPKIIGSAGELGLMQIRPCSAEWIAKKAKLQLRSSEQLFDPAKNIQIGAAYLSMLREQFDDNKHLYLSAYNMGPKNVRRLLESENWPKVYVEKTLSHYSKIYIEFYNSKKSPAETAPVGKTAPAVKLARI